MRGRWRWDPKRNELIDADEPTSAELERKHNREKWPFGEREVLPAGRYFLHPETSEWVRIEKLPPREQKAPYVHMDEIPGGLKSMVDRQLYYSKAKLRRHYRNAGVVEIGEETNFVYNREDKFNHAAYMRQLEEDSARAYYEVRDNMAPLTELDKERCKIINNNLEHYNYDRRERKPDGSAD